jgi:hypothetical protein
MLSIVKEKIENHSITEILSLFQNLRHVRTSLNDNLGTLMLRRIEDTISHEVGSLLFSLATKLLRRAFFPVYSGSLLGQIRLRVSGLHSLPILALFISIHGGRSRIQKEQIQWQIGQIQIPKVNSYNIMDRLYR